MKINANSIKKIYIYGAGSIAYGTCRALEALYGIYVPAYIVSARDNNPEEISGKPVLTVSEAQDEFSNEWVLVATPSLYHAEIGEILQQHRVPADRIAYLDDDMEYSLMGEYLHDKYGMVFVEDFRHEDDMVESPQSDQIASDVEIAMAYSKNDKPLMGKYIEPQWVKRYDVLRTDGENIADKNNLYGELCSTYYLWKNIKSDIKGLFHYRRDLDLCEGDLDNLKRGIFDVFLPNPFVCYPDTKGQYGRYLNDDDVDVMKSVLRDYDAEFAKKADEILAGELLYNYNIVVARSEVFDEYCEFLFTCLERIENICESTGAMSDESSTGEIISKRPAEQRERLPRYIARIGEILTSLYFQVNADKYRIVHAKKEWRV